MQPLLQLAVEALLFQIGAQQRDGNGGEKREGMVTSAGLRSGNGALACFRMSTWMRATG